MLRRAELYLNGCLVGRVKIKRQLGAWGFGEFAASAAFAAFRDAYDRWATLMHSGGGGPLDRQIAAALSEVECALDRIHGQLLLEDGQWLNLLQLNIDGNLAEWEEHDAVMASDRRMAGSQDRFADNEQTRHGVHFAN